MVHLFETIFFSKFLFDRSRHLMGHRLNLLKVLHRDLFIVKNAPCESSTATSTNATNGNGDDTTTKTRHLALEIFEVPKGVRVFPLILRFLFSVS